MSSRFFVLLLCFVAAVPAQKTANSPYAVVTTTDGKRIDVERNSFQWWAVLDDDLELLVDGANFESIERRQTSEPAPNRGSGEQKEKWIAVSARRRNGGDLPLWLPESMESCNSDLCDKLRALQQLRFLDTAPGLREDRERPPTTATAKLETVSGRAIALTAAQFSGAAMLEIPLSFTEEKMMQRPPSERFFVIRSGDLSLDAMHSRFWVRIWPAQVTTVEQKDGAEKGAASWSVSAARFPRPMVAKRIADLKGLHDGLWSRVPSRQIRKASLAGLRNVKSAATSFEGEHGPSAVVVDRDRTELRLRDLHLRRIEHTSYQLTVDWLPNLTCRSKSGKAEVIPFARLASITVARRPDPLLLKLQYKDGRQEETECDSRYGEFDVLLLGGFHQLGQVQIPLADVAEIRFPPPPAKK